VDSGPDPEGKKNENEEEKKVLFVIFPPIIIPRSSVVDPNPNPK
jgi:hypothetical protein